jgi:hypothetical protein
MPTNKKRRSSMRKNALYLLAAAAALGSGCEGQPPPGDAPEEPATSSPAHVDDTIRAFTRTMYSAGLGAQQKYQQALQHLQRHTPEAVPIILARYRSLPRQATMQRWSALYTLGELGGEQALDELATMAAQPLPDRPQGPAVETRDDADSEVGEEIKLRLRALGGLGVNVKRGSARASTGLINAIKNGPPLLREMAAAEYLRGTGNSGEAVAQVKALLTASEQDRVFHPIKPVRHGPPPHEKSPVPPPESAGGGAPTRKQ